MIATIYLREDDKPVRTMELSGGINIEVSREYGYGLPEARIEGTIIHDVIYDNPDYRVSKKNRDAANTLPDIQKVIYNNTKTIVLWADGTKTVVTCGADEFDKEKGLAMAIAKKAMGNKGHYYEEFKKWINY